LVVQPLGQRPAEIARHGRRQAQIGTWPAKQGRDDPTEDRDGLIPVVVALTQAGALTQEQTEADLDARVTLRFAGEQGRRLPEGSNGCVPGRGQGGIVADLTPERAGQVEGLVRGRTGW
jgi:hypothetical protein